MGDVRGDAGLAGCGVAEYAGGGWESGEDEDEGGGELKGDVLESDRRVIGD